MAHQYWPLFDLVVRTPRLELRYPDDPMLVLLAEAGSDIFGPGENQFAMDWTSETESERQRHSLQWWWKTRAEFSADRWWLTLAVLLDGEPVGVQDISAERFVTARSVESGSWLRRTHRNKGLGREMRSAVLHLAFDGLGAVEAHSVAFDSNAASIGVSRAVGYEDNGEEIKLRGSLAARSLRFRMSRERFEETRRADVTIEGLEACLELFGLGPDRAPLGKAAVPEAHA